MKAGSSRFVGDTLRAAASDEAGLLPEKPEIH